MGGTELQLSRRRDHVSLACALLLLSLPACNAFDRGKLLPPSGGAGGAGGTGGETDAGDEPDGAPCTPSVETCNGIDEDCDGVADEDDMDALAACETVVVHSRVKCVSTTMNNRPLVVCVGVACDPGFSTCDGIPSNGCEHEGDCQSCLTCEDAGDEDSGPLD